MNSRNDSRFHSSSNINDALFTTIQLEISTHIQYSNLKNEKPKFKKEKEKEKYIQKASPTLPLLRNSKVPFPQRTLALYHRRFYLYSLMVGPLKRGEKYGLRKAQESALVALDVVTDVTILLLSCRGSTFGVVTLYFGVASLHFACPYNVMTLGFNVVTLL